MRYGITEYSEKRYHRWFYVCPECHEDTVEQKTMSSWKCKCGWNGKRRHAKHIYYKQPEVDKVEIWE